jgi:hypothetical protein
MSIDLIWQIGDLLQKCTPIYPTAFPALPPPLLLRGRWLLVLLPLFVLTLLLFRRLRLAWRPAPRRSPSGEMN